MNKYHDVARKAGWWDDERISSTPDYLESGAVVAKIPEKLCLIHSEVSEALEDFRNNTMPTRYEENGKPVGFLSEIADIVIRCYDLCGALGLDLDAMLERKHEFNKTRPYRHGGKRA